MLELKESKISNIILAAVLACTIFYCVFFQFISPVLYGEDSYYHIAVSKFIKEYGPHYKFHWTQFSTFKDFFSDKEFLFHLSIIPFLHIFNDDILAGKYAVIFYNILFLLTYLWLLRKYLPNFLVACFLLVPFLSSLFTSYFIYLRSATLANIITIAAIYFLINKRWLMLAALSLLYPLSHVSFLMLVIFAVICEILRYFFNKEFFFRNIYVAAIGTLIGCFLHPNFPNNFISLHLNFFLVPFYTKIYPWIDFGDELFTPAMNFVFMDNFAVFLALNFVIWMAFWARVKVSLSTCVWWACTTVYLALSFFNNRHWYIVNVLFFVFFASYLKDWLGGKEWRGAVSKIRASIIIFVAVSMLFMPVMLRNLKELVIGQTTVNMSYEDAARWMKKNIPAGEVVYHTFWYDSPYFICLNPKNDYIVALDPIYMLYRYPKEYLIYRQLTDGRFDKPYDVLPKVFKSNYGYARKGAVLLNQIKKDDKHFKILYENDSGVVFKVLQQN